MAEEFVSLEDPMSRKLYKMNSDYLFCRNELSNIQKKKINKKNLNIFLSYLRSGAYTRILNRISRSGKESSKSCYTLNNYTSFPNVKVVVYTCIWGRYDSILEPIFQNKKIDYRIITDQDIPNNSIWKKQELPKDIDYQKMSPIEINRLCKMLPHRIFPSYDFSIYIDGNIRIITDLMPIISDMGSHTLGIHKYPVDCIYEMKNIIIAGKRAKRKDVECQIKKYLEEGFPKHYGAYECNILVRKHNDLECIDVMEKWWEEFNKTSSKRDQISLPYILWKLGKQEDFVYSLGDNVWLNPRFQIMQHIV